MFFILNDRKSIIFKNNSTLFKLGILKSNGVFIPDERTQDVEKTLGTCTNDDIIRRTDRIPFVDDIITYRFAKLPFTLGFSIGQHSFILAKGALNISSPQVKVKTVSVCIVGGEIIDYLGCCIVDIF